MHLDQKKRGYGYQILYKYIFYLRILFSKATVFLYDMFSNTKKYQHDIFFLHTHKFLNISLIGFKRLLQYISTTYCNL